MALSSIKYSDAVLVSIKAWHLFGMGYELLQQDATLAQEVQDAL
jgi:hypothetical protein